MAERDLLEIACITSRSASDRPATCDDSSPSKVCTWARYGHCRIQLRLELMHFEIDQDGPPINKDENAMRDKLREISRCQWKHLVEITNNIEKEVVLLYDLLDLWPDTIERAKSIGTKSSCSMLISHVLYRLLPFLQCH